MRPVAEELNAVKFFYLIPKRDLTRIWIRGGALLSRMSLISVKDGILRSASWPLTQHSEELFHEEPVSYP
jgi:hypothetical protein